jgi:RNase P/RNase MRP subunit POP5
MHLFDKPCGIYGIYLTRFDGEKGVIRCFHTAKQDSIHLLKSITKIGNTLVTIEPIGTSGTMKTLLQKYFDGDQIKSK